MTPANSTPALDLTAPDRTGLQPLSENPAAVYLASLGSDTGRRSQLQALDTMAGILTAQQRDALSLDWSSLRFQHTAALRAKLSEVYSPATVNKFLSALRQVLKTAWRLGLMTADEYQRAADLQSVTGETIPAGRELSTGEIKALMDACMADETYAGTRDAALIGLLYASGLRRAEVIALDLADYDNGALLVLGKRNKQRTAYVTNGAADALADWLSIRGSEPGPLFLAVNKGGKIHGHRLTAQAVYNILAKRAQEAGIKAFSPHDLRRSFVSHLLAAGEDISTVAKMAGHSNVQTTARYDRRPEEAKRNAAKKLHVPYSKRS